MIKKRADVLLFEKGLADSREKAKTTIMEGVVFVGDKRIDKPGEKINQDSNIIIKKNPIRYVSRGGIKLEKALNVFDLKLKGKTAIDIGASTGGFTDCMLKNGIKKVYAIDVGYGQLDWSLRGNPKVIIMERTNIRYVSREDIGELADFISIDVSFISLRLVLKVAERLLNEDGYIVALIKPQFEAGRDKVSKGGIVKEESTHTEVINDIIAFCSSVQLTMIDLDYSPITGSSGNIEFLSYITKSNSIEKMDEKKIAKVVKTAHWDLYKGAFK